MKPLKCSDRIREYQNYPDTLRGKIAIEHLTNEKIGHREFDKTFLGLDSNYTRGFQSMGILHYQGLTKDHHGVLKNNTIQEIINIVKVMDNNQRLVNDITSYFKNKPINKNMLDKELEDKVINSIKDDEKSRNSRIKNYNGIPQKVETVSYSLKQTLLRKVSRRVILKRWYYTSR